MWEHWWHCLLWFRHHVPQEEEETPRDLSSTELWAPCPYFIWPKGGQICGPAASMAEYSRHAEAPQASGRPFKDHEDATPAYEGKRGRLLFPVLWTFLFLGEAQVEAMFPLPHIYLNGAKGGICKEFSGYQGLGFDNTVFFWGDSNFIGNKGSSILNCSSVTVQRASWLPVTRTRTRESSCGSWQGPGCVQLLYRKAKRRIRGEICFSKFVIVVGEQIWLVIKLTGKPEWERVG